MPDAVMKRSALDRLIAGGATATKVGASPPPSLIVMDPEQLRALIASTLIEQLTGVAAEIAESLANELDAREEGTLAELRGEFGKIDGASRAQVRTELSTLQTAMLTRLESMVGRLEAVPGAVSKSLATRAPALPPVIVPPASPPSSDPEVLVMLRALLRQSREAPQITVEAPAQPRPSYRFTIVRDDFGRIETVLASPE